MNGDKPKSRTQLEMERAGGEIKAAVGMFLGGLFSEDTEKWAEEEYEKARRQHQGLPPKETLKEAAKKGVVKVSELESAIRKAIDEATPEEREILRKRFAGAMPPGHFEPTITVEGESLETKVAPFCGGCGAPKKTPFCGQCGQKT